MVRNVRKPSDGVIRRRGSLGASGFFCADGRDVRFGSKADVTVGDDLSPPLMHNRTPSGRKCPCYTIGYSVTFPNLWHR